MTDTPVLRFLDDLRAAIIAARFEELPALIAQADGLVPTLATLPSASLERIRSLAERNGALIRAAEAGVRAGRRRLMEPPVATLGVYDTQGRRERDSSLSVIEHRA